MDLSISGSTVPQYIRHGPTLCHNSIQFHIIPYKIPVPTIGGAFAWYMSPAHKIHVTS